MESHLSQLFIICFLTGSRTAWCTTDRGLFLYNTLTNRIKQVDYPRLSNSLFGSYWSKDIIRLQDSSILFSTFGGLYHIRKRTELKLFNLFRLFLILLSGPLTCSSEDSVAAIYIKEMGDSLFIISPSQISGNYEIKKRHFISSGYISISGNRSCNLSGHQCGTLSPAQESSDN